jgi:molecular chaperone DnaK (HSP70)
MSADSTTGPIVGIDLGTTNSLVAVMDGSHPRVLGGEDSIVPSVVRYEEDGSVVVGSDALDRAPEYPKTTLSSIKRLMGRSLVDARDELRYLSYDVVEGAHKTARVKLPNGTTLTPQEVSAAILRELKERAERELGVEVSRAVVTVPAYFDDAQRHATRDAGRIAGLDIVRIVNEPTAAALAYGLGTTRPKDARTIGVFDLGGGTFDISILRLIPSDSENPTDFFQVVATSGDTRLGGDDVDHMLMALFAREISDRFGVNLDLDSGSVDPSTRRALSMFARGVKHALSSAEQAPVRIDLGSGRVYERVVTRTEFESMIGPWVERALQSCTRARRDAKRSLGSEDLDALVMVGGSTRIPLVRERAGAFFGVEPYTGLDPDKVVAMGAAVQASILSGETKGSLLVDVIPLSLGLETAGGAVAKLVMRNTSVPTRAVERFSTQVDGQVNVKLHVVQGEREMVEDCRSLGTFELRGIPPMPAGVPKLVVEFMVDANGVLDVSAVEERSGKRAQIQIVPNHGLSREEVDRLELESVEHAKEDMARHRIADLVTNSSLDLKWINDRFAKHGGDLDDETRADLVARISALAALVERAKADWSSVDPNALHEAKEALDRASVRLQEVSIAASLRAEARESGG